MSLACGVAMAQAPADALYTQPGTLIPAGTHRLNFYCMGNVSPTVIMGSAVGIHLGSGLRSF
jgi:hypothetical protein